MKLRCPVPAAQTPRSPSPSILCFFVLCPSLHLLLLRSSFSSLFSSSPLLISSSPLLRWRRTERALGAANRSPRSARRLASVLPEGVSIGHSSVCRSIRPLLLRLRHLVFLGSPLLSSRNRTLLLDNHTHTHSHSHEWLLLESHKPVAPVRGGSRSCCCCCCC